MSANDVIALLGVMIAFALLILKIVEICRPDHSG
ncbi:hypothetical protein EV664_105195 [Stakelama pacifica]|uniref:Uncharacterized protein n=1 Tax=Stakelama pacifica TaxID=517720 RepID=A0A4R6FNI1_9SPHN|nr:hypothetical protein EV664_105195 [Stakelama pacifica]